jgi:hypothetical protein
MRKSFFRFWVSTAAVWAAVASIGGRLQAQQAETKEFAFVINSDEDEAEQEEAPKFWLGIALKPVEGDLATYIGSTDGVLVDSVYPDSPASKAGLEKGDIVVAVGEQKLTDPKSLLAQMLTIKTDEEGKAPALKLKVLRKGEAKAIELTPVARPAEMKVTVNAEGVNLLSPLTDDVKGTAELSFDLNNKSPEEIEKMVEELHGSNVRILRFGTPAKLSGDPKGIVRMEIHKSVDGKNLEISINREGDGPAKVTVKQDGETKEYSSDKMDDMPKDIRKMVTEMLDKKGKLTVQGSGTLSFDEKANVDVKHAKEHIAELRNRIALVAPTGNFEIAKVMDRDMAEKVSEMAKEIAARAEQSSKWAQAAAAMPEEVKELKSQVESLRAEIKELRDQLKATLKSTSDK